MPSKKLISAAVLISLIGLVAVWAGYFRFMRLEKAPDYIETTGVIEATEVDLTPKAAGRIEWLCCKEGDGIKAGAKAVILDGRELKARVEEGRAALDGAVQALNEARVNLENARVQQDSARYEAEAAGSEVERVKALADDAGKNLERARGLFKDGYIPRKDLDAAQTAYSADIALLNSAKARKSGSENNIRTAEVNIKAAQARIGSADAKKAQAAAQVNVLLAGLADTEIISPIDGVIVYKAFETGEYANPGSSIYTVDGLNDIWARLDVEESRIHKIKAGNRAEAVPPGGGKVFGGSVTEIGEVGGFATQRDVTRGRPDIKTFRVKVRIDRPEGLLKPGMTVKVRVYFS